MPPFSSGRETGFGDGEVGEALECVPRAAGAALLDLDRPDGPPGFIAGDDVQAAAVGEAENQVLKGPEPAGDAAGVFRGGGASAEAGRITPALIASADRSLDKSMRLPGTLADSRVID